MNLFAGGDGDRERAAGLTGRRTGAWRGQREGHEVSSRNILRPLFMLFATERCRERGDIYRERGTECERGGGGGRERETAQSSAVSPLLIRFSFDHPPRPPARLPFLGPLSRPRAARPPCRVSPVPFHRASRSLRSCPAGVRACPGQPAPASVQCRCVLGLRH